MLVNVVKELIGEVAKLDKKEGEGGDKEKEQEGGSLFDNYPSSQVVPGMLCCRTFRDIYYAKYNGRGEGGMTAGEKIRNEDNGSKN